MAAPGVLGIAARAPAARYGLGEDSDGAGAGRADGAPIAHGDRLRNAAIPARSALAGADRARGRGAIAAIAADATGDDTDGVGAGGGNCHAAAHGHVHRAGIAAMAAIGQVIEVDDDVVGAVGARASRNGGCLHAESIGAGGRYRARTLREIDGNVPPIPAITAEVARAIAFGSREPALPAGGCRLDADCVVARYGDADAPGSGHADVSARAA